MSRRVVYTRYPSTALSFITSYYRELRFRTIGLDLAEATAERIAELANVSVLRTRQRKLGLFERERLFVDEYDCSIIVSVTHETSEAGPDRTGRNADPYRHVDDVRLMRSLQPALADIIEAVGASQRVVEKAMVRFETRAYQKEVCERLAHSVDEFCSTRTAKGEVALVGIGHAVYGGWKAVGRIRCSVRIAPEARALIRRSGLVDADQIRVEYA